MKKNDFPFLNSFNDKELTILFDLLALCLLLYISNLLVESLNDKKGGR